MMKRKLIEQIARAISQDLYSSERNCDGMIADLANIALKISTTREAAGLPVHHGQDPLQRVANSLSAVTLARAEMIRLHDALAAENKSLGEPLKLTGDVGKPSQFVPELVGQAA